MNISKKGSKKRRHAGYFPPLDFMQQGNEVAARGNLPSSASDLLQKVYQDRINRNLNILAPEIQPPNLSRPMPTAQKQKLQQEYEASKAARDAEREGFRKEQNSVFFEQFGSNPKVREEIIANYNQLVDSSSGIPELDEYKKYQKSISYSGNYDTSNPDALKLDCHGAQCYDQAKEVGIPFKELSKQRAILNPGESYADFYKAADERMGGQGKYLVEKGLAAQIQNPGDIQENDYVQYWKEKGGHNVKVQAAMTDPATGKKYFVMEGASPGKGYTNNIVYTDEELKALKPYVVRLNPPAPPATAEAALPQNQNGGMVDDGTIFVPHAMLRQYQQGGQTPMPPEMMQQMMPPEGMIPPMQQQPGMQQDPFADITLQRQPDSGDYAALLDYQLYNGQPNVEVEAGEFMQTPDGQTYRVSGDRHYEGGEDIAAPADSRVFSDHLKVSKGVADVLGFGSKRKKRRGMTYADVAKKLDTAKLDKLVEEEADPILRNTSTRMRDRNARKLDMLFQVQQVHNGEALKDQAMQNQQMQQQMPPEMMPPQGMPMPPMQGAMPMARFGTRIPQRMLPMAEDGRKANIMSVPAIDYGAGQQSQFLPVTPADRTASRMELTDNSTLPDALMPAATQPGAYQPKLPWMQLAPAAYQLAANASRRTTPLEQNSYNDTLSQLQNQRTGADFSAAREQNNRDYRSALRQIGFDEGMSAQLLGQKLTANQGLAAQEFNTENALQNQQSGQLAQFYQGRDQTNQGLRDQYNVRDLQSRAVQQQNIGNAMQSAGNVLSGWQRERTAAAVAQQMNPNVRYVTGPDGQPMAVTAGTEMYFNTPAGQFTPLQYDRRRIRTKTDRYGRRTTEQTYDED